MLPLFKLFFSFRAFETTQNTVTLVPEIHLSSQKLTPVGLGGERDVRAAPQMGSGWQGPPGTGAELCYLFSLHCRSGWCWGVVLGWELQGKEQLCPAHCPGLSGCCSLCCPSSSGPTATAWREGQERGWRGWIRSDILFPAEHLRGKREGNVTITENELVSALHHSALLAPGPGKCSLPQEAALVCLSTAPSTPGC